MCTQMLMHAIAHRGCTDTVREFALKVDSVVDLMSDFCCCCCCLKACVLVFTCGKDLKPVTKTKQTNKLIAQSKSCRNCVRVQN